MAQNDSMAPGIALRLLGIVGILFGLAFGVPGINLMVHGGSWFFAIAGVLTVLTGWLIFRGDARGVYLYLIVCAYALIWSLWDVRHLDSWFWPLIPRLFSFAVALCAMLLLAPLIPAWRGDRRRRNLLLISGAVVAIGLGLTFAQMFKPHGVVRHDFAAAENTAISPAALQMGDEWRNYGRTTTGTRFTPIDQINKDNIGQLEVAWTYETGTYVEGTNSDQNTPTYANGTLYSCTPLNQIHAIDPMTGKARWVFDPHAYTAFSGRCRGLSYYEVDSPSGVCARRLAMATIDARLFSIDADTGEPCQDFGAGGMVNMREGMEYFAPAVYMSNSAPTVSHGMIVSGGLTLDNYEVGEPSGVIRAWDAQTGALAWAWDIGAPERGGAPPPAGQTYTPYTPNVWSHMAVDEERGLIYLPTGNATPDVWLSHRRDFDHEYTDTIVALDIMTGKERWHFRTTNRDLWDYDLASQPVLYDIPDPETGEMIPVLIQLTKRGQIFMLNRETGEPVAEVEDRQIDTSGGEPTLGEASPVQPYSVGMPAVGGGPLTEADMWGATPIDLVSCRMQFRTNRYNGTEFVTPSTEPNIGYPSSLGGMNWGSGSIDESRGLLFVNDIRFPMQIRLVPREKVPHEQWPKDGHAKLAPQLGTPFGIRRDPLTSVFGLICLRPPYGTMTAVDLNRQQIVWQRPMGTIESLDFIGVQTGLKMPIGMPTLGGSLSTGSGLLFFDGAMDHYLRVMDSETGEILREIPIPLGATATPMSFVGRDGKQYIVISVGGASSAIAAYRGDYVIAFRLPDGV